MLELFRVHNDILLITDSGKSFLNVNVGVCARGINQALGLIKQNVAHGFLLQKFRSSTVLGEIT